MNPDPLTLIPLSIGFSTVIYFVVLVLLLIISGFISGSEVAFFSLSPSDIENAKDSDSTKYKKVLNLISKPKKLLASILIANNFVNIAIVLLSTYITADIFEMFSLPDWLKFSIEVIVITFLLLLFGEVLPKVYANKNALKFSSLTAGVLDKIMKFTTPISAPMMFISDIIEKNLNTDKKSVSVENLEEALNVTKNSSTSENEKQILKRVLNFGNTEASQIMTPRVDLFSISTNQNIRDIISKITEAGFSRIPVYKDNIDEIKGILYVKDLLPHINDDKFEWRRLIKKAFFVPENKKINDLLSDFQSKKIHISIVVDEYGGTSGVVSLEDIMEEIIGEIDDELDTNNDAENLIFDGKTSLVDLFKKLNLSEEKISIFEKENEDSDTLAGFIIEKYNGIPEKNTVVSFSNFDFKIISSSKKRIEKIQVIVNHEKPH